MDNLFVKLLCLTIFIKKCQLTQIGYILNGFNANITKWPFIAFITYFNAKKMPLTACGASLISSQTLLTAAHCLDGYSDYKKKWNDFSLVAYMGHSVISEATMLRLAFNYMSHEDYQKSRNTYGDIGVVFLTLPVEFSPTVKKILLNNKPVKSKHLYVAGWGICMESENGSEKSCESLKSMTVKSITEQELRRLSHWKEEDTMIYKSPSVDRYVFSGDSGGPLVDGNDIQVGVTSFNLVNYPKFTFYVNVTYYYNWIWKTQMKLFIMHCKRGSVERIMSGLPKADEDIYQALKMRQKSFLNRKKSKQEGTKNK